MLVQAHCEIQTYHKLRFLVAKETDEYLDIYTDRDDFLLANLLAYETKKKVRMIILPTVHFNKRLHAHTNRPDEQNDAIELLDSILIEAIKLQASDIHLSPEADHAKVVLRVAGELLDLSIMSLSAYETLLNRIKVLAHFPLAKARQNYEGHFSFRYQDINYDIRVASLPCVFGEVFVLRLFNYQQKDLNFKKLNYKAEDQQALEKILELKQGLVLCTGPTGSGKTSCLYALLNELQKRKRHIITLEDPVERKMAGIKQLSIQEGNDIDYQTALACVLRLDPDVLMIGEIRDEQTAAQAVSLSLTGHLVFSTLHTKDACAAITRLRDLKIPAYLLSASLSVVIAHRLKTIQQQRYPLIEVLHIDQEISELIKNEQNEATIRQRLKRRNHHFIDQLMKGGDAFAAKEI